MRFSDFARSALRTTLRTKARCVLVLASVFAIAQPALAAIPQTERDALVNLYNAAAGTQWTARSGWNGSAGTECTWSGVSCDSGQTTVVGLNLANNHLAGTLAPLGALTHLTTIDISQNALTGSLPSLGGLSQLKIFNAYSNQFTGGLPDLSSQTALQQFRVWGNQLSGSLPALTATTNLIYFDASSNQLTGTIPSIAQLGSLELFVVGNNQLTGAIPSLTGLGGLKKMDVSYNRLTGGVPDLSGNAALQTLYVDHNNLSGALPSPPSSLAVASVCPNAQLVHTASPGWDLVTGQSPWYARCSLASMFVISDINSGYAPAVGSSFSVTVGLRDSNGVPAVATDNYYVNLSVVTGSGQLNAQTCYINTGSSSCTLQATYSVAESGVRLQAASQYQSSSLPRPEPAFATLNVLAGAYTVSGTVTGLAGSGLVLRLSPTGQTLTVNTNGAFSFSGALGDGAYYSVGVAAQPPYPLQSCSPTSGGSGIILGSSISSVTIVCTRLYSMVLRVGPNGQAQANSPVPAGQTTSFYVSPNQGYRAVVTAQGCTVTRTYTNNYSTSPLSSDCVATVSFVALDYTPLGTAIRVLNTPTGGTTVDGSFASTAPLSASTPLVLPVLGRGGIPASGVGALVLNVVATNTSAPGYATVWPSCAARPNASNLNFLASQTVSNLVIVPVGCDATINLLSSTGPTDFIVDVVGYFNTGASLTSLSPSRLLDTRPGYTTIDGLAQNGGPVPAQSQIDLTVAGRAGIPANAGGVALNVTATDPTAPAFVTVWPTDQSRPNASSLNVVAGQTIPNLVIAKLSAAGKISLFNSAGATDLIADAVGWFPASSDLTTLVPARLVDTRGGYATVDGVSQGQGPITGGQYFTFNVLGRGGLPAQGVGAVVLNVTATNPRSAGFLALNWLNCCYNNFVQGINYSAGQTVPNLVIVPLNGGSYGQVYTSATTDVVIDVVGWIQGQ